MYVRLAHGIELLSGAADVARASQLIAVSSQSAVCTGSAHGWRSVQPLAAACTSKLPVQRLASNSVHESRCCVGWHAGISGGVFVCGA
jgi:hypothetical protein